MEFPDLPPDFYEIYRIPGFFHGHVSLFQMFFYHMSFVLGDAQGKGSIVIYLIISKSFWA